MTKRKIAWNKNKSCKSYNWGRQKGCIPWNKGLTKEKDKRVQKYGETAKKNKSHQKPNHKNSIKLKGYKYPKSRNKKISRTIRRKIKSGEWQNWNKGYTKETHPSIKKISDSKLGKTFEQIAKNVNPNDWKNNVARKGKDNGSWRGGISFYRGKDWPEISKAFKKKNKRCKKCGKLCVGYKHIAHHIIPHVICKNNKELMSLCRSCHIKLENKITSYLKTIPRKGWRNPESVETIRLITRKFLSCK